MVYNLITKEILNYLKKQTKPISCLQISYNIDVSYPTIIKHIDLLNEQGIVSVEIGGLKGTAKMVKIIRR